MNCNEQIPDLEGQGTMNKKSKTATCNRLLVNVLAAATVILTTVGAPKPADAQEWQFDPIVKAGWEVDDNAVLSIRTDEEVEISGYQGDISAALRYRSELTTFTLDPRVRIRRYDESEFDSTDGFVRINFDRRGQSSRFQLRTMYEQENVRTAERADPDLGEIEDPADIPNDDTGIVEVGGDRDKLRLKPSWSYNFSNTMSAGIELDYFDVAYDDVFAGVLVDYTDTRAEIFLNRDFSRVTTGLLVIGGRSFRNEDEVNEFDGYGVQIGFERQLSPTISLRVLGGVENADFSDDGGESDSQSEFVGEVVLRRTLETIQVIAQYKRAITASSTRFPTIRDNYNLNFTRQLTEKISAGLGARAYQTDQIRGSGIGGRDYVKLAAGLEWRLSRTFLLEFEVSHTIIDRGGPLGESADSNQVGAWFVYRPNTPEGLLTR